MTQQDLIDAAQQLGKTDRGRNALRRLLDWLDDDGLGLDGANQSAVFALLCGAFGKYPGTARDVMRDALSAS